MKNFFQKQREAIVIASFFAIVAILAYFVIFPLLSNINSVEDKIQEEILKQEIVEQQIRDLPKLEEQYSFLLENEKNIDVLLDKNNAVVLIEKLEKLAQESGNKIEISVQEEQAQSAKLQTVQRNSAGLEEKDGKTKTIKDKLPSADYMQIKVVLDGNYNSIVNFIKKLESFEYYSDIVGIQIGQNESFDEKAMATDLFSSNDASGDKETENTNKEELEASLDIVFYTKI